MTKFERLEKQHNERIDYIEEQLGEGWFLAECNRNRLHLSYGSRMIYEDIKATMFYTVVDRMKYIFNYHKNKSKND